MAAYEIPFRIQEDIMKRLPVKSLIRFRSVSKAWKSLIDSSEFITAHSLFSHTQPQHLLVSYRQYRRRQSDRDTHCLSYVDDDNYPQQMSVPTVPLSAKQLHFLRVIGSSHGLLCLLYASDPKLKNKMAAICNPSIRKSILVDVPSGHFVSFGVCPVTTDPKIVATRKYWDEANRKTKCEVMVYTLSSGKWRSVSTNLPTIYLRESWPTIATKQFIYWCARSRNHYMIMLFDLTHENFERIDLPDGLASASHELRYFNTSKIRESLTREPFVVYG